MPYEIQQRGNQYCVVKVVADSQETMKCYADEADARRYLAALEINVVAPEGKAFQQKGNRIEGYMVRFTDAHHKDLQGEYFTKDTYFWEAEYPIKGIPIMIDHAFDAKFKGLPVGIVDFVEFDEVGIWIEAKLKERDDYLTYLQSLRHKGYIQLDDAQMGILAENITKAVQWFFDTGEVQFSSGAHPQLVEVEPDGFIKSWRPIEVTGVMTPAEPNGTNVKLKQALDEMTSLLTHIPTAQPKDFGKGAHVTDNVEPDSQGKTGVKQSDKDINMDEQKMDTAPLPDDGMEAEEEMEGDLMSQIKEMVREMIAEAQLGKSLDADAITQAVEKAIAGKSLSQAEQFELIAEHIVKFNNDRTEAKAEAMKKLGAAKQAAPAEGRANGYSQNKHRVEGVNDLRFAHLSASDMALGALLLNANPTLKRLPLSMTLSEDYLKHMTHKASEYANGNPYDDRVDHNRQYTLKAAIPFKADELDASVITGQGLEWVGEFWSTDLWRKDRFARHYDMLVDKGMMVRELPRGVDTGYFPTEGADPTAYTAPEARSVDASGRPETTINISPFGTGRVSVTPKEIKIATSFTEILDEDSVINVSQEVNRQLREKALETRDQLLVNGDTTTGTTNINYDGTTVPSGLQTPYYVASNGFRYLPLVTATGQGRDASGTLDVKDYLNTFKLLDGELRQYKNRMVFMVDPDTELATLDLLELRTDDVRSPIGTVTNGEVTRMWGIDVVSNGWMPLTASDGKVTANVAGTLGTILLVYAPYWGVAYKRQVTLETARDIYSGSNVYVMSMRLGVMARGSNAAAMTYNVSVTIA